MPITNVITFYPILCILSNIYIHLNISTNHNTLSLSSNLSSLSNKSFGGIVMKKSFQLYIFMLPEFSWRHISSYFKELKEISATK